MDTNTQLLNEIETLRKQLHKVIKLSGGNLLSEDVLTSSQKLDKLLIQYLKEQKDRDSK